MTATVISAEALGQEIAKRATGQDRFIVAVAGPPGAGKSTLSDSLVRHLGAGAAVLPMDGFHLENEVLEQKGLLHRKGAPETFDADGFVALARQLRHAEEISYPTFDRGADRTVPGGGRLGAQSRIVVMEGNYLLLNRAPWTAIADLADMTVMLDVPRPVLEARLIQRWLDQGLAPDAARTRAQQNDLRNADEVLRQSQPADYIVRDGDGRG